MNMVNCGWLLLVPVRSRVSSQVSASCYGCIVLCVHNGIVMSVGLLVIWYTAMHTSPDTSRYVSIVTTVANEGDLWGKIKCNR
jgi:hypothetical protein